MIRKKKKLGSKMRNLKIRLPDVVQEQKSGSRKAKRRDLERVRELA